MDLLLEYLEIMRPVPEKESKNHGNFRVVVDYPALYKEIEVLRKEYEEGRFTVIGSEHPISKEEYLADIDRMWKDLTNLKNNPSHLKGLVNGAPKKKNGTFCKGRVLLYSEYKNTAVYYQDWYGWKYYSIRMKTLGDTEAVVYINREIQSY